MKRKTLGIMSVVLAAGVAWACSDGPAPTQVDPAADAYLYQANAPGGGGGKAKVGVLPTGCYPGQVAVKKKTLDPNNEEWICADDRDRLGALDKFACTNGQVPKWDSSLRSGLGDWYCGDDNVGAGGPGGGPTMHFIHYQWDLHTSTGTLTVSPGLTHLSGSGSPSVFVFESAGGESLLACAMVASWNQYFSTYTHIETVIGNPAIPNTFNVQGGQILNGSMSWSVIITCP